MAKTTLRQHFGNLVKDSFVYGLGNAFLKILGLLTVPIFTRVFLPADYGVISLVAMIISFLSLLLIFGMDSATARSYYEYKKHQDKNQIISSSFWFLVIWAVLFLTICGLFTNQFSLIAFRTSQYRLLFILAFGTAFLTLLINFAKNILRLEFKAKLFTTVVIVNGLLVTGLNIFFVVALKFGLLGYFVGGLLGTVTSFILAIVLIRKRLILQISWPKLKRMLLFGSMLVPTSVAYFVFDLSDRFFISRYNSLTELGLYALAINVSSLIVFFSSALGQAWSPYIMKIYFESKTTYKKLVSQALIYFLVFFFSLSLLLVLFTPELLRIFTTESYFGAARAVGPLAVAMVFLATTQISILGITISEKTKYLALFAGIAALVNIGLNFLLIPRYGMVGAAWATAISYLILTLSYFYRSQKLIPLAFNLRKIFSISIVGLFLILVIPGLIHFATLTNITLKSLTFVIFLIMLYLLGVFERQDLLFMKRFLLRFVKKTT